jgi:hypothetical protein
VQGVAENDNWTEGKADTKKDREEEPMQRIREA